jgi:hypothetical protein
MRKKKLTYREKWLKEHPKLVFYLDKKTYKYLNELESIKGIHKKDIILNCLNENLKIYENERNKIKEIVKDEIFREFIENPAEFYFYIKYKFKVEPILFSIPCKYCGKEVIVYHKDKKAKDILRKTFRTFHVECYEKAKERII